MWGTKICCAIAGVGWGLWWWMCVMSVVCVVDLQHAGVAAGAHSAAAAAGDPHGAVRTQP